MHTHKHTHTHSISKEIFNLNTNHTRNVNSVPAFQGNMECILCGVNQDIFGMRINHHSLKGQERWTWIVLIHEKEYLKIPLNVIILKDVNNYMGYFFRSCFIQILMERSFVKTLWSEKKKKQDMISERKEEDRSSSFSLERTFLNSDY